MHEKCLFYVISQSSNQITLNLGRVWIGSNLTYIIWYHRFRVRFWIPHTKLEKEKEKEKKGAS